MALTSLLMYVTGILRYQVDFQMFDAALDGFDQFNLDDYWTEKNIKYGRSSCAVKESECAPLRGSGIYLMI